MAKIGDLQIESLKIANGQVTEIVADDAPVTGSSGTMVTKTTTITVANVSAAPLEIGAEITVHFYGNSPVSGTTQQSTVTLTRVRGNVVLYTWSKSSDGRDGGKTGGIDYRHDPQVYDPTAGMNEVYKLVATFFGTEVGGQGPTWPTGIGQKIVGVARNK
jgi:hypothetical protein